MVLSESVRAEIRKWMDLYPGRAPALGHLPASMSFSANSAIARSKRKTNWPKCSSLEPAEVGAVVGFYNMFHEEPKGEYHVEVCTNVPCMLRGANQCMHHLEENSASTTAKRPPMANSRSTTWNVSAPVAPRPWSVITESKTGKIRYFEELDSAEDVERC